jgi:sensor c-di-GMP phosphodiesterase-like protein
MVISLALRNFISCVGKFEFKSQRRMLHTVNVVDYLADARAICSTLRFPKHVPDQTMTMSTEGKALRWFVVPFDILSSGGDVRRLGRPSQWCSIDPDRYQESGYVAAFIC